MAEPHPHPPVKPVLGVLTGVPEAFALAREAAEARWGAPDVASEPVPFDATRYYEPQMGAGLMRRFLAFPAEMDPAELPDVKLWTNGLERRFSETLAAAGRPRPVNLDPGYLTDSKLVLASTKDFAHRIYMAKGIFAEITLAYREGAWQAHEWTFPDFRAGRYKDFLDEARAAYMAEREKRHVAVEP